MTWNSKVDTIPDITRKSIYHTYRLCYLTQKENHHGNEAEPSIIEKYFTHINGKKAPRRFACSAINEITS